MLKMRGILEGEGDPIPVKVLMNAKTKLGKVPDQSGKIIVPLGTCLTAGEKFLLVIVDAEKANLGLPCGDSMNIVIDKVSENYAHFLPTAP